MRTLTEIKASLAAANVQEVARRSGVNAKTLYRITNSPPDKQYEPSVVTAQAISEGLDAIEREAKRKTTKVKPSGRPAEEHQEA
ncbi:hypothetical protein [Roseateles sp. P5_E11]